MNLKKLILVLGLIVTISCGTETNKFTTADGNELEISSLIGMDVFDIAYEFSKVGPETLVGTNNERWVVYYKDIDVTFETDKSTNIVQKASKGKNPKEATWAK